MKCTILESVKHTLDFNSATAEKVLDYMYQNYVTANRAVERVDKLNQVSIFPQGQHPSVVEWDVTKVEFTTAEIRAFCKKYPIERVVDFLRGLVVID